MKVKEIQKHVTEEADEDKAGALSHGEDKVVSHGEDRVKENTEQPTCGCRADSQKVGLNSFCCYGEPE